MINWRIMLLILCLTAALAMPAAADEAVQPSARSLIERIVVSYAANGVRDEQALSDLAALDPSLGEKWTRVMDLWAAPVTVNDALPDGLLPDDDSLCLVALGFQLSRHLPGSPGRVIRMKMINDLLADQFLFRNNRTFIIDARPVDTQKSRTRRHR